MTALVHSSRARGAGQVGERKMDEMAASVLDAVPEAEEEEAGGAEG